MTKLLSVLIAAFLASVSYSAIATDEAMAPAKPTAEAPTTKAKQAAPKKITAQQAKMKLCNKEAKEKGLKKADRKAFMKSCLKNG